MNKFVSQPVKAFVWKIGSARLIAIYDPLTLMYEVIPVFASAQVTDTAFYTQENAAILHMEMLYNKCCNDIAKKFSEMFMCLGVGKQ